MRPPPYHARPLRRQDLPACAALLATDWSHPGVNTWWSQGLPELHRRHALYGAVVEREPQAPPVVACGVGFFLAKSAFEAVTAAPPEGFEQAFYDHVCADHGILDAHGIGKGNAGEGLCVCMPFAVDTHTRQAAQTPAVWVALARLGASLHAGYRLASMVQRVTHAEDLRVLLEAGGGRVAHRDAASVAGLLERGRLDPPAIVVTTWDDEVASSGRYAALFASYTPPRFLFTLAEQQLLSLALHGGHDADIAAELGVSQGAVKKRWEGIYARVQAVDAAMLPAGPSSNRTDDGRISRAPTRGPEKRSRLLNYLAEHPEELRPYVLPG